MRILSSKQQEQSSSHVVLMFGLGMIGSAISESLCRLDFRILQDLAMDWNSDHKRASSFAQIKTYFSRFSDHPNRLSIVWSAGKVAFDATSDDVSREQTVFCQMLDFAKWLKHSLATARFDFHFLSSAGGLFEGQQVVGTESQPSPIRPYGQLKLDQESLLKSEFKISELALYRPSSVYGPMIIERRRGLINNLVNNGRNERETVLDAHVMSLRDYVFSHDIGSYVARTIRSNALEASSKSERFLVSSRCSSIFEVVRKIERVLNQKLRVRYDEHFGNNRNITFSPRVLPPGWHPVTLDTGIKQFLISRQG